MIRNTDEDVPVRSIVDFGSLNEDKKSSQDETDESTLRQIYLLLKDKITEIDMWHAFERKTDSELTLKQQIKAREIAYNMVNPAFEAVRDALVKVDKAFVERNS